MQIIVSGNNYLPRINRWSLSSSLGTLGTRMTFSIPTDPTDKNPPTIPLGAPIRLAESGSMQAYFDGIITGRRYTDTVREYTAYDFCYYLNKSPICIQFAEQRTDLAIAQLWDMLGIKRIYFSRMQGVIEGVTYIKTPSAILRTLLDFEQDVSGNEYFAAAEGYGVINILPVGFIRSGLTLTAVSSPRMSDSLDEVRNRIYYAIKSDDGVNVVSEAADESSIEQYGQIADYIVDSAEPIYTAEVAQKRLARLRLPWKNGEVTVPGDFRAKIGLTIAVEDVVTDLSGDYIIDSVTHDATDGVHLMTLGLSQRGAAA